MMGASALNRVRCCKRGGGRGRRVERDVIEWIRYRWPRLDWRYKIFPYFDECISQEDNYSRIIDIYYLDIVFQSRESKFRECSQMYLNPFIWIF